VKPAPADPLSAVEDLLRRHMGLEPETLGRDHIAQAFQARVASHGKDPFAYLHLLAESDDELRALVDEVVVPETWFFRDRSAFRHLRRRVRGPWSTETRSASEEHSSPFRVLSVPCCTGEEPYSIAMTLLDGGLNADEFEVIAADISPAALAAADDARYAPPSFRERDPDFVALEERFCRADSGRRVVDEIVRDRVRFHRANLAAPHFLDHEAAFHAIFCRNLFIYLDESARRTALGHLRRLLRPGGIVYFSAVEAGVLGDSGLQRLGEQCPTAFILPAGEAVLTPPSARRRRPVKAAPRRSRIGPAPSAPVAPRPMAADPIAARLTEARRAADAGRLDEAAALCTPLAAEGPPQADVLCLLGVVRQAQGDLAEAERCFQRVLYLDPRHGEAVVHMALLARRRGDQRLADTLLRRLEPV